MKKISPRFRSATLLCLIAPGLLAIAAAASDGRSGEVAISSGPLAAAPVLSLNDGRFSVDLSRYPVSGSPSAKHVIVIINDYTCPFCRETERTFTETLATFAPGDVALVHLPGIREKKDGPLMHRIMLALWQEHPAIYRRLSEQMFFQELPAEPAKVRAAAAAALGGTAELDALIEKHRAWIDEQIEQTTQLMLANATSPTTVALPQVMIGEKVITGSMTDSAELQTQIKERCAIVPIYVIYAIEPIPPDANDPCEPTLRQTCARLVISMIGAGEPSSEATQSIDETVPNDRHASNATRHLLQFTADNKAVLPSKHLILTSDPDVKTWIGEMPFGKTVALEGIVDNSIPAFNNMVNESANSSALNKAINGFARTTGCKKLMSGNSSVLPFLKVDIIVDGELAESNKSTMDAPDYGITSFKKEGTVGTLDKWMADGTVIGKEQLSKLMSRLSGSLVHVFAKVCKTRRLANVIDEAMKNKGICGCTLGVSDDTQDNLSGGTSGAPFNFAMPDQGKQYLKISEMKQALFGMWRGANTNMLNMTPALLEQQKLLLMYPLDSGSPNSSVIRNLDLHKNILFGFGDTSANALADRALSLLQKIAKTAAIAKQIADAEFTDEIEQIQAQKHINAVTGNPDVDANLQRIAARLKEARSQSGSLVDDDPRSKLSPKIFNQENQKFRDCFRSEPGAESFCSVLDEIAKSFRAKTETNLTANEKSFGQSYNGLKSKLKEIDYGNLWPLFIEKRINLSEFNTKMGEAKLAFMNFQKGTEPYLLGDFDEPRGMPKISPQKKKKTFKYLNDSFEKGFNSAREQTFELLKRETITTKLDRLEMAMELLAQNLDAVEPPGAGEALISEMASKLNCLTQYQVGPAHDYQPAGPYPSPQKVRSAAVSRSQRTR